ncbi:MAG: hypothetical protein HY956_05780 [Deltaproteobacteria bacterium]|nr:hypothetical protein [Deltaproteobacteria bacterium]
MNDLLTDNLTLEYRGSRVEHGTMNAYEVARNILAFSDFISVISKTAYGDKAELQTEIQGFRGNSFDIDFLLSIGGVVATLLTGPVSSPKDFITLIKDSVKVWIHLMGKPPKAIEPANNGFKVENQKGEITNINGNVFNIITNINAGKAVEEFIKKPLESGIDFVKVRSKTFDEEVFSIDKRQAQAFIPIETEKPIIEQEYRMGLTIESPTFKEGNKWRFFDGSSSFHADVLDQDFLTKVNAGEIRFGKGDILIVLMKFIQSSSFNTPLKIERAILKVLEHKIGIKQTGSLFDPKS